MVADEDLAMRSRSHPLRLFGALALLAAFAPGRLTAELRVELIELPPDPIAAEFAVADAAPQRLSTLSERFAGTGLGRHFVRLSPEKPFGNAGEVILYTDPLLLSRTSPAHTNVVVDLQRQRVYLMTGRRILMESEVCVSQSSQTTPSGFFGMTERVKNGPIAENLRTSVPYWMQLGSTELGLHGGQLYGYASAGACVRLPLPAAEILFEKTQEGTPVAIFESWSRDNFTPPALETPAAESVPPLAQTVAAAPLPQAPLVEPVQTTNRPALSAAPVETAAPQASAPTIPPALPSSLRPVSGTPLLQAPPLQQPSRATEPSPVSSSAPAPAASASSALLESGKVTLRKAPPLFAKPNAPASKSGSEVARLRNIFLQSPAESASRAPLFPAADKRAKRIDLGSDRERN